MIPCAILIAIYCKRIFLNFTYIPQNYSCREIDRSPEETAFVMTMPNYFRLPTVICLRLIKDINSPHPANRAPLSNNQDTDSQASPKFCKRPTAAQGKPPGLSQWIPANLRKSYPPGRKPRMEIGSRKPSGSALEQVGQSQSSDSEFRFRVHVQKGVH